MRKAIRFVIISIVLVIGLNALIQLVAEAGTLEVRVVDTSRRTMECDQAYDFLSGILSEDYGSEYWNGEITLESYCDMTPDPRDPDWNPPLAYITACQKIVLTDYCD